MTPVYAAYGQDLWDDEDEHWLGTWDDEGIAESAARTWHEESGRRAWVFVERVLEDGMVEDIDIWTMYP